MTDYKNGKGDCPDCDRDGVMLIDTTDSAWTPFDEVCGHCIKKHGDRVYREARRAKRRESDLSDARNTHYERF